MTCTLPLKYNQTQKPTIYYTHKTIFQKRQRTFTGKGFYAKTDRYYYEARYLDPRTSRWLGVDPAMGEHVPSAGKENKDLPNGGVYNYTNLHTFHYSNNNPVKYKDPDGKVPYSSIELYYPPTLPSVKDVRQRIADYAKDNIGSTLWNYNASRGRAKEGTWKCNLFVYEMATSAGASPGTPNGGKGKSLLRALGLGSPPTAEQWADPNYTIPGWRVLPHGEAKLPGDVAAEKYSGGTDYTGHVSIVTSEGKTTGVSNIVPKEVKETDWGFRENQKDLVIFRRWEGNE